MIRKFLALTAASLMLHGVALAEDAAPAPVKPEAPAKATEEKKPEVKLIDVRFCPMMGSHSGGQGVAQRVYEDKKLYFCCPGCAPGFDALSAKDKAAKVAAVVKKQQEADKKKAEEARKKLEAEKAAPAAG